MAAGVGAKSPLLAIDPVPIAYIALGGNLQDPTSQVSSALDALGSIPRSRLEARSALYRTAPMGAPGQPDYINAAARLVTDLEHLALLDQLLGIEQRMGRQRDGSRWGPRVIDLDLLLYDQRRLDHPRLSLPHPELHNRAFVLIPLADVAPSDLRIPGQNSLGELVKSFDRDSVTVVG